MAAKSSNRLTHMRLSVTISMTCQNVPCFPTSTPSHPPSLGSFLMPMFIFQSFLTVCFAMLTVVTVSAEPPKGQLKKLTVYPESIALNGPRAEQRLGVIGEYADGRQWDLSRESAFTSGDTKIVAVDGTGFVRPAKDGQTTVTVESNGIK